MFISFKYKIMFSFFLTEVLFLSFIIIYNYNSIHNFTQELIDNKIQSNTVLFKELIKTPVLVYDLATLDDILSQFGKLSHVNQISIRDNNAMLLSKFHSKKPLSTYYKEVHFPIMDENTQIGKASIIFELETIYTKINNNTDNIIRIALVEIIFSLLLSYLIASSLSKHLINLNNAVKKFKITDTDITKANITSNDEFKTLWDSFELMQVELKKAYEDAIHKEVLLFKQSKMAQMGSMIGNIAHQWKQPLEIINAIAMKVQIKINLESLQIDKLQKDMSSIQNTIHYLDQNINTFRNFLMEIKEFKYSLISESLRTAIDVIRVVLKDNFINLDMQIDIEDEKKVYMISGELIEVIINIVSNAKDALLEKKIEEASISLYLEQKESSSLISIQDNAEGISEDILPFIFNERFSTKDKKDGMGLGLYMSKKIVTSSLNGTLLATNAKNGALFTIQIPHTKKEL